MPLYLEEMAGGMRLRVVQQRQAFYFTTLNSVFIEHLPGEQGSANEHFVCFKLSGTTTDVDINTQTSIVSPTHTSTKLSITSQTPVKPSKPKQNYCWAAILGKDNSVHVCVCVCGKWSIKRQNSVPALVSWLLYSPSCCSNGLPERTNNGTMRNPMPNFKYEPVGAWICKRAVLSQNLRVVWLNESRRIYLQKFTLLKYMNGTQTQMDWCVRAVEMVD